MALLLALSLLLAACGDSGDSADETADSAGNQPAATSASTDTPAPEVTEPAPIPDPVDASEPTAITEPTATAEPALEQESDPADPAPEFGSIDSWHNTEPLTLAGLRGSPVLLVFWADF